MARAMCLGVFDRDGQGLSVCRESVDSAKYMPLRADVQSLFHFGGAKTWADRRVGERRLAGLPMQSVGWTWSRHAMTERIHSTPPEAMKQTIREKAIVDQYTFELERPTGIDQLWEHPAVRNAYAADEYIPYWTELWPAGRMLAKMIVREDWTAFEALHGKPIVSATGPGSKAPNGPITALEVGCGLGLAGIAALAKGMHVIFTDIDVMAAELAGRNAKRNGFTDYECRGLDFRAPPPGLQVPLILASDVLYEPRFIEPMVAFIQAVLMPNGLCLVGDADRISAKPFKHEVDKAGLAIDAVPMRVGEPGGTRTKGTIYRISHSGFRIH
jgi:Lysine methyltransferase